MITTDDKWQIVHRRRALIRAICRNFSKGADYRADCMQMLAEDRIIRYWRATGNASNPVIFIVTLPGYGKWFAATLITVGGLLPRGPLLVRRCHRPPTTAL